MERYLLDTNIVSFLVRRSSASLDYRFHSTLRSSLALSAVCEAELLFGIALLPPAARVGDLIRALLATVPVLPWDSRCASSFASMGANQQRLGKPLAPMDALIAAHAMAYDFVLVSNDSAFLHVEGLRVEDWTRGPQPA